MRGVGVIYWRSARSSAESTERQDERVLRILQIATELLTFTHQRAQYPGKARFSLSLDLHVVASFVLWQAHS